MRLLIGYHFRTSENVGARLRREAARFVVQYALRD
jgi:hypothetical protein